MTPTGDSNVTADFSVSVNQKRFAPENDSGAYKELSLYFTQISVDDGSPGGVDKFDTTGTPSTVPNVYNRFWVSLSEKLRGFIINGLHCMAASPPPRWTRNTQGKKLPLCTVGVTLFMAVFNRPFMRL